MTDPHDAPAPSGTSAPVPRDPALVQELNDRLEGLLPQALEDLQELVRIPSVAFPGYDPAPVRRSAEAVAELLRGAGLQQVGIESVAGGAPAVIGRTPAAAGAPTVLLYAHHDVQPTGDPAAWSSQPFEPEVRGERLYGRGAADDKAGVMAHVTALRLVGEQLAGEGTGVTVFVEGEEEAGSPTFRDFIETHREALAADVIIVADSANWAIGTPALTTSLRGLVDAVVEVEVLEHAVHSGIFGGPVMDAITQLSRLLATLHDEHGEVAVEGLHRAEDPAVEMDEAEFRADAGVPEGVALSGRGPLTAQLWTRPAISVIGLDAPKVAEASNTLVPSARAKVSLRIPPGQDPQTALEALEEHLRGHAPATARVTVEPGRTGKPYSASQDSAAMTLARTALGEAWGVRPVDTGLGGSIPFIADLLEVFPHAEVLVTGVEDPQSRAHGIDESLHLGEFARVCVAEALLLRGAGALREGRA